MNQAEKTFLQYGGNTRPKKVGLSRDVEDLVARAQKAAYEYNDAAFELVALAVQLETVYEDTAELLERRDGADRITNLLREFNRGLGTQADGSDRIMATAEEIIRILGGKFRPRYIRGV